MSDLVSEDHILARIASHFPNEGPDVLLGRGDDCAVLGVSGPLCVSTDLFMEDVHFRRSYFTPEDIGWKALAVNLSDLAADGARPMGFTVGLSLPPDADMALVDGRAGGPSFRAACGRRPLPRRQAPPLPDSVWAGGKDAPARRGTARRRYFPHRQDGPCTRRFAAA